MRTITLTQIFAASLALLGATAVVAQDTAAGAGRTTRDVRFVVLHTPGPMWQAGKSMLEQPGIREHVAHYRKLLEAGKLVMGGPHLDGKGGGMMIPSAGVGEEEIRAFANDDPAVKAGVLLVEVRPWLVGMSK